MGELILALAFEFFGPVILIGLAIWGIIMFRRARRLKKSLGASKGDATARALEALRLKATIINVFAFIFGAVAFYLALTVEAEFGVACFAGVVVYSVMALWARALRRRYNVEFKENIVTAELSKVFDNLEYQPDGTFDADTVRNLAFFTPFEEVEGSDLITAEYKGIRFTQSDVSLLRRWTVTREVNGESREEVRQGTLFNGRVMRFDFADAFKGDVQVVRRDFGQARVMDDRGDWQELEVELAEFGEDYRIFAEDPVAAMSVLTPQMIEGIYFLEKKLRVPLALYFTGQSMFVFMALARDAFDTSNKKTLLEEREFLEKDIALVTGFLETMYFKDQAAAVLPLAETSGEGDAGSGGVAIPVPVSIPMDARNERPQRDMMSGVQTVLQRLGYKVSFAGNLAGRIAFFTPLTVYVASAVYILAAFPDGFSLSYSSVGDQVSLGDDVPTLGYLAFESFLLVPSTLGGGMAFQRIITSVLSGGGSGFSFASRMKSVFTSAIGATVWLLPFWIHLFFLNANMLYR